jgi:hypothetical protein
MGDTNVIPLTEVRENIGQLVSRAYYTQTYFGVSKGKQFMGAFVSADIWQEMIRVIEQHNPGLADTLAVMADPELQTMLEEGARAVQNGSVVLWEQVQRDLAQEQAP